MPRWPRIVLATVGLVVGLVAVVYGTACLTGAWLGEPPWSERHVHAVEDRWDGLREGQLPEGPPTSRRVYDYWEPDPNRDRISLVVVGLGLVPLLILLAVGAWTRRRATRRASRSAAVVRTFE